jgi:hypothetical protein
MGTPCAFQNVFGVRLFHERFDDANLIRHLGTAENNDKRLRRFRQLMGKILDLLFHQESHGRLLHELRDAGCAGMRPMRRAKGVVHVEIAQLRERFGERRIVCFFARMEANVLQQCDIALVHVRDDLFRDLPDRVVAERDRMIDERVQIIADRPQRIFLDRLPLRPPEMRHQDRLRAIFAEVIDGRQTFTDASVIGDGALATPFFGGNVEIDPDQQALALHLEITQREFIHSDRINRILQDFGKRAATILQSS